MSGLLLQKTTLVAVRDETSRVRSFTFRHAKNAELPPFTAGAHVGVETPGGQLRYYSLCSDPHDRTIQRIGVLREDAGSGGSRSMHAALAVGDTLYVTRPRNYFPIVHRRGPLLLLAAGIGVTPILAMLYELERSRVPYALHYCARNRADAAFADEIEGAAVHGSVHFHFDNGNPADGLPLDAFLAERGGFEALYACGPKGFLDAIVAAAGRWPEGTVHFERFSALPRELVGAGEPFEMVLQSSGQVITVAEGQTALSALRDAGHAIRAQCEAGICGTCRVKVVDGTIVHKDAILSARERADTMMVCVSRAAGRITVAL